MAPSNPTTTAAAAALHTIVIVAAILGNMPVPTSAVLGGSYIPAASFASSHPFRGAVQSGGGTGIVLFRDGDEAVILTVAHGYDLTTKTGKQVMDFKLNSDGGLRSGFGVGQKGYVMPADNIVQSNLGLWRYFSFGDAQTCPLMNAGKHSGNLDDPYGCSGLGPDIDLALQRVKLTSDAAKRDYPELLGPKSFAPLTVGQDVTLVGFGRKHPCVNGWDGESKQHQDWRNSMGDALKVAQNKIRGVMYSEAMTEGLSTVSAAERVTKFGCGVGESVSDCAKRDGAHTSDPDSGDRFGTGCAGDSGASWLTKTDDGTGWNVVGVNRGPGKAKTASGEWRGESDNTFKNGLCNGGDDLCESFGTAMSTLYPMRQQMKAALSAWNPAWAKKVTYTCEPPSYSTGTCGAGCHLCATGDAPDCYPNGYQCNGIEELPSAIKEMECGDALGSKTTPRRKCSGSGGSDGKNAPCRGLTVGTGWRQEQVCLPALPSGKCPALTRCCGEGCSSDVYTAPPPPPNPPAPPSTPPPSTPPPPTPPPTPPPCDGACGNAYRGRRPAN